MMYTNSINYIVDIYFDRGLEDTNHVYLLALETVSSFHLKAE
jgi:hypothetical protein